MRPNYLFVGSTLKTGQLKGDSRNGDPARDPGPPPLAERPAVGHQKERPNGRTTTKPLRRSKRVGRPPDGATTVDMIRFSRIALGAVFVAALSSKTFNDVGEGRRFAAPFYNSLL